MLCPVDGETLLMTSREGVEIDYCPRCRGVWLDRGELDKIIERAGVTHPAGFQPAENRFQEKVQRPSSRERPESRPQKDDNEKRYGSDDYYRKRKHKTKSFLKEIFDFD